MSKVRYLIFSTLFFGLICNAHASENDTITAFKKGIDSLLVSFRSNPSDLKISKQLGGRKVRIKGTFDNGTKSFKQKIKFSGGVKKESIVVKYIRVKKNKQLLMKAVYINDQYFFLAKHEYSSLEQAVKSSKETYTYEGVYKRVKYNANKKVINSFYLWSLATPDERL